MYKIMVLLYYYNIHQVLCKEFISVFFLIYRHVTVHMEINRDLVKQVRTPPVRPADGVVGCVYESFVPGENCCGLGLRAKIKSAEHAPAL